MFSSLNKLLFITLISISLIFAVPSVFAQNQKQATEDYEKYLETMRKEVQKLSVQIMAISPMREGRDRISYGSGFAILKEENKGESFNGETIKYITYYIYTAAHVVGDKQAELEDYQKDNIRIYILGKKDKVSAQIVAWEWGADALLLRVDISEKEAENFKIQVAKIASKLPVSIEEARYSDEDVPTIYLGGYPGVMYPVGNRGYVSRYLNDYDLNEYTRYTKVALLDVEGFSGAGQSGAAIFNRNLEIAGVIVGGPQYAGSNVAIAVPVDVIVERFLKKLAELKSINLPNFTLEDPIKNRPIFLGRPKNVTINNN